MNRKEINARIADRADCFYWKADRKISEEEAAIISKGRAYVISNKELLEKINKELKDDKLVSIRPLDEKNQTSLDNVNLISIGLLESGKEVIIRHHPKGIENGYFNVEDCAAKVAKENHISSYRIYCIHQLENKEDISYQLIEKEGDTIQFYLRKHPEKEKDILYEIGKTMAKIHQIHVFGFGPFNNKKTGILEGQYDILKDSVIASLDENLERLVNYNILTQYMADKIRILFENNELLNTSAATLIHNNFADWNLLTDGNKITAIVDWNECVGGHPVQEIAHWATFFNAEKIHPLLKGYFSEIEMYDNFEEMFQLMRLRYTISKVALEVKKYTYEQTPFLKNMIEKEKQHLSELLEFYNLDEKPKEYKKN